MPDATYKIACAGLVAALVLSCSRRVRAITRAAPLLVAASAVALTFVALLVTWTDIPAQFILGIQGRYFTAPAILAAYALSEPHFSERRTMAIIALCGSFIVFSVAMTTSTLLWKYYL